MSVHETAHGCGPLGRDVSPNLFLDICDRCLFSTIEFSVQCTQMYGLEFQRSNMVGVWFREYIDEQPQQGLFCTLVVNNICNLSAHNNVYVYAQLTWGTSKWWTQLVNCTHIFYTTSHFVRRAYWFLLKTFKVYSIFYNLYITQCFSLKF
jgi:hypothetical protein